MAKGPSDARPPARFVPLTSLKGGHRDPAAALAEIRRIYFATSKSTIDHDLAHAIELLKSLPEEERDRAAVYMEGLAQMQREWEAAVRRSARKASGSRRPKAPRRSTGGSGGDE